MTVLLLSGGMDSTVAGFWARAAFPDEDLHTIAFNYSQRHWVELERAVAISRRMKAKSHECVVVGSQGIGMPGSSSLTRRTGEITAANSVLPGRNLIFLTTAAAHAEALGEHQLVMGCCKEDADGYPDCRREFIESAEGTISLALDWGIDIAGPLLDMTKADTIRMAEKYPGCMEALAKSWSCYDPQHTEHKAMKPSNRSVCGVCPACVKRAAGFAEAGVEDPAL